MTDPWPSTETCTLQSVLVHSSQEPRNLLQKLIHITSLIKKSRKQYHTDQLLQPQYNLEISNRKVILKNLIHLEIIKHFYYSCVKEIKLKKKCLELNDNEDSWEVRN